MLLFPILLNSLLFRVINDADVKQEEVRNRGRPRIGWWGSQGDRNTCAVCTRASAGPPVFFTPELGEL